MEAREYAQLVSETGETVVIVEPDKDDVRSFPVAVWRLTDGRSVVVVGEGGPISTGDVDGVRLIGAVHARWPDAIVLERRPEVGSVADPRGYAAGYVQLRSDGSRGDPVFADLAKAGFAGGSVA